MAWLCKKNGMETITKRAMENVNLKVTESINKVRDSINMSMNEENVN